MVFTSSFCNLYLLYTLKEENSDENPFFHAKVVLPIFSIIAKE